MDGWQPLAPTKRASGMYARANVAPPSPFSAGGGPAASSSSSSYGVASPTRTKEGTAPRTAEERRATILQGPSDPFPPVGVFPRSVVVRILSYLTLGEQRTCALAGRALARAVADESNWSRRLYALDWCRVDGLTLTFPSGDEVTGEDERELGRRRKRKQKKDDARASTSSEATTKEVSAAGHSRSPPASAAPMRPNAVDEEEEDEFGDFAGPSTNKDAFADFQFDKALSGGSLASGTASVAMGGGRPHNFSSAGTPSFSPLLPTRLGGGNNGGGATARNSLLASKQARASTPAANGSLFNYTAEVTLPLCSASPSFRRLRTYAKTLRPFLRSLADTSAPATNSLLFTCDLGLAAQTALLSNLLRFISTSVGGGSATSKRTEAIDGFAIEEESDLLTVRSQDAAHRLLGNLLSSFEGTLARRSDAQRAAAHGADTTRAIRRAEDDMRTHANGVWELGNARLALALSERDEFAVDVEDHFGRMKAAKVFLERCEVLTSGLRKHDPLANVTTQNNVATLDFTPMDQFIAELIGIVKDDGEIIARIFPPEQDVLLAYGDRIAQDVIARYVRPLLNHSRNVSQHMYLRSCAATFAQSLKLVDILMAIEPRDEEIVTKTRCEDVVYLMWEDNMDDYLQVEQQWVRQEMQAVTEKWESDVANDSTQKAEAAFLGSHNPAAVKRSVLTSFKDVLLLPVTVVPRAAGAVGGAVIRTAGTGLSTLNPLRWQSGGATSGQAKASNGADSGGKVSNSVGASAVAAPRTPNEANEKGYMDFSSGAIGTMDSDDEDDDDDDDRYGVLNDMNEKDEWNQEVAAWSAVASTRPKEAGKDSKKANRRSAVPASLAPSSPTPSSLHVPSTASHTSTAVTSVGHPSRSSTPVIGAKSNLTQMQLLLSLDTALQVIHVNRDCLKRIETFKSYPAPHGELVRVAMQDVSLLLFRALGEGHISPGFEQATKQIQDWKPEEHVPDKEQEVEPLVHFFELVHVGDTIAQMVQVYFEQEMARHIDKNDFLNPVVKGRKRFESHLDEAVARGMNAGVDLLMGQAEHIIMTRQEARDYNPVSGQLNDLSPTRSCKEAVACLSKHCRMLVGTTDKNVLEVFHQEVGIRLHAIICKNLKRQTISLDGGFRVIADLNEYHAFIATLRQSSLTADFDALKMLGNLYIIDNPKELAKLARDANMFGGSLSPEDLYEFLQARSDFKSIEKAIDKEMYGFKISEDCCVC